MESETSEINIVTVTSKGTTTIPVEFRKKYKIREGTRLEASDTGDGVLFRPIPDLNDAFGIDGKKALEMTKKLDRDTEVEVTLDA